MGNIMNNLNNIQSFSSKLLIVFGFALFALPLMDTALWFAATLFNSQSFQSTFPIEVTLPLSFSRSMLGYLPSMLPTLLTCAILWQLILLFRLYKKGQVFTLENTIRYRKIANILIMMPFVQVLSDILLSIALSYTEDNVEGSFNISDSEISVFVIGLIVRVIAKVMEEASLIREEQELTI
ncbi:DUF2975 domain-containing protein [Aliivibrio fischeri]|nr:DUF2975 domain-containing protein [Aliivibrio fischeri]MUI62472.1 DUF2975 domain-containing protein [Aliivibrio fischeri]MUL08840.1 DUF2975 domain-containing protein [Aliivibrio fischeri]MUL14957.1 DUF2975 domain-containing protein [Aliivibrio fischeri]